MRDGGTNFAVEAAAADSMLVCLFDEGGAESQIPLLDYDADVWHGFVPGVGAGQAYGYRAGGPLRSGPGPALQPGEAAARPVRPGDQRDGELRARGARVRRRRPGRAEHAGLGGARAAQPGVDDTFRWSDGARPRRSYADTIIYEVHVKGFTMRHPGVPAELRGTYAGLGHEAAISHLLDLGVTAVELLPVHESVPEAFLPQRGLTNYWGYNTIGYFAPHQGYSAAVRAGRPGGQVAEFKAMVDALHRAGLEVLLDVVFNHTAEGRPARADAVLPGPRQPGLLPARPRRPDALTSTPPAAATRSTSATPSPCS